MTVGASKTRMDIDATAAQVARQLFSAFEAVKQFKAWLDTQVNADLEALGYSAYDVAVLKSALADLDDLAKAFDGTLPNRPLPYAYQTFAKQLLGTGLY